MKIQPFAGGSHPILFSAKRAVLCVLTIFCFGQIAFSQVKIISADSLSWKRAGDSLIINYQLPDVAKGTHIVVSILVLDSTTGRKIHPVSMQGDVGKDIPGGKEKKLIWNYAKDNFTWHSNVNIIIEAYSFSSVAGGPGFALLSIPVPGLGNYFVSNAKFNPGFLFTIASYGFVGYGLYQKAQSDKNYSLYHGNTLSQSEMDNYYTTANQQYHNYEKYVPVGAAIWGVDIIYVALKGLANSSLKKKVNSLTGNMNFQLNAGGGNKYLCIGYKF